MRHRLRLGSLLVLSTGCALASGCSSEAEAPEDLATRLQGDTGVAWSAVPHAGRPEPRLLVPERPVRVGEGAPEDVARAFFLRYQDALKGTGDASELRRVTKVVDEDDGGTVVRFEHVLPGTDIPVLDTDSIVHFTKEGELAWAEPSFRADLAAVPREATIGRDDAIARARDEAARACAYASPSAEVETGLATLAADAPEESPARLVWRVGVRAPGCGTRAALVDATSGAVLDLRSVEEGLWDKARGFQAFHAGKDDIKTIDVTEVSKNRWKLASTNFAKVVTYNYLGNEKVEEVTTDALGSWSKVPMRPGVEVDAHFHAFHALAFWRQNFRRDGLDGRGGNVVVVVHKNDQGKKGKQKGRNASFIGSNGLFLKDDTIVFGDGNYFEYGGTLLPFGTAFDVVVHETAHAVTKHTSELVYRGFAGALNESFSDVMAATAERWFYPKAKPEQDYFRIGEDVKADGTEFRSMLTPKIDHLSKAAPCTAPDEDNDYCGVHDNSGIPNRVFSLLAVGGKHAHSNVSVISPLGWEAASKMFYKTFTELRPQATFLDAATAQILYAAARGPQTLQAVACAWYAVGVVDPAMPVAPHLRGLVCPDRPTRVSSCDGIADGWICNSQMTFSATHCVNGRYAESDRCDNLMMRCKQKGPDDFSAVLDAKGRITCE